MALLPRIINAASLAAGSIFQSGGDDIGILDTGFLPVFNGAKILGAEIRNISKVMNHPVEDGSVIADHKIQEPIEITLNILLDAELYGMFEIMKNSFLSSQELICQVRGGIYKRMIISEMPHREDTDFFRQLLIILKLKEVIVVQAEYGSLPASKVENKKDASTIKRGQQITGGGTTNTALPRERSSLHRAFF